MFKNCYSCDSSAQTGLIELKGTMSMVVMAVGLAGASTIVAAQDQTAAADHHSGSIIILREVPYGTALERQFEAEPLRVQTSPEPILLASLTKGLEPLTDAEQGAVFGSTMDPATASTFSRIDDFAHIETALGAGVSRQGSNGGSAGRIVSDALGSLPSVGAILRNVGTGQ